MVQRMIENDLLAEINYENVPNLKYIDDIYMEMSKQYQFCHVRVDGRKKR